MIIAGFQVSDKFRKTRFFQETFLIADTSVEVIFGMPFLTFSKVEINFAKKILTWKTYTITKALPTTKKVQIISPKKFAKVVLDPEQEVIMVRMTTLFQHLD